MADLFDRICGLNYLESRIFLNHVFDLDDGRMFLDVLAADRGPGRDQMLRSLDEGMREWIQEQLDEHPAPDEGTAERSRQEMARVLDDLGRIRSDLEARSERNRRLIEAHRRFMKDELRYELGLTDQARRVPPPPVQKDFNPELELIDLPDPDQLGLRKTDVRACINDRRSRRKFTGEEVSLGELSYLLWATQGVQKILRGGYATLRTVPSGGMRHAFETYLAINRVGGLEPGIYRYLGLQHKLVEERAVEGLEERLIEGAVGQGFVGRSAVVFVWSCIPYRAEWRYSVGAHRVLLMDVGHLCQNLYLACESLELGTCGVAAYSQEKMDCLLELDGLEEYVVYLAPVGRLSRSSREE